MKIQSSFLNGDNFSPINYFLSKGLYPNKIVFQLIHASSSSKVFELLNEYFSGCEIRYNKSFSISDIRYNNIYIIKEDKIAPFIIEYNNITKDMILYAMNNELEDTLHKIMEMCNENKN